MKRAALDCKRHRVLAGGSATAFAAADNFALAVGELVQQLQIFVVHEQRPGTLAVNEDWVFLLGAELGLGPLPHGHLLFVAKRSKTGHGGF